jgi:hypothetical protein
MSLTAQIGRWLGWGAICRTDALTEPLALGHLLFQSDRADPVAQWKLHEEYQIREEITAHDGTLRFSTPAETADEWAYVYLDPRDYPWKDFSWQFKVKRETRFREFAFNFRYQDFDNRYRYRFEDDKLYFDKKVRGEWYNNISSILFPMPLGQWHQVRIDVCASLFRCYVDSRLLLENVDTDLATGSICVILWEDDGRTPILAEVGPMNVYSLRPGVCLSLSKAGHFAVS